MSHNEIENQGLQHLYKFENLRTLVLDHNLIKSDVNLNMGKPIPSLELLWVNSCNISNLSTFIEKVRNACPNLQYFSMLKNKACPNFFVAGGSPDAYQDYRYFVISRFPKLKVLDTTPITDEEKQTAMQHYATLKIQPTLLVASSGSSSRIIASSSSSSSGNNITTSTTTTINK